MGNRYNTIRKVNSDWGIYEEKYKKPQWINMKTGERYDMVNKENFDDFIKRLKEETLYDRTRIF